MNGWIDAKRIVAALMAIVLAGGSAWTAIAAQTAPDGSGPQQLTESKPNIIWIVGDDHGGWNSEPYGDTWVKTPQMARLAREGMRLTHAYAASPLCSPSRAVMATGLYPYRNGGHVFGSPISNHVRTLPEYFHELGYYLVLTGKDHFIPRPRFPFDERLASPEAGAEFLEKYAWNKPLVLLVCSHHPHTPWPDRSRYSPDGMPLPPRFVDTPETRNDITRYYEEVSLLDDQVGQVLDALKRMGKDQNTLVLYTSDQGANLPFGKWSLYDRGLRAPLLARWPGRIKPGTVSDALISFVDLLPTCIEAAGAVPPSDLDGRSFLGVLTGQTGEHGKMVYGEHSGNLNGGKDIANLCPARTVIAKEYHYILNLAPNRTFTTHITGCPPGDPHHLPLWQSWLTRAQADSQARLAVQAYQHRPIEELYDLNKDPGETENVAGNAEYSEVLTRMRQALNEWRRQQADSVPICLDSEPADHASRVAQWQAQLGIQSTPPVPRSRKTQP